MQLSGVPVRIINRFTNKTRGGDYRIAAACKKKDTVYPVYFKTMT